MLMNFLFIKRQNILALFRVISSAEEKVKKMSIFGAIIGIIGIILIVSGYYVSSKLFDGDFTTMNELTLAMGFILAAVIIGTYLFYKGSVSFIFNQIGKRRMVFYPFRMCCPFHRLCFEWNQRSFDNGDYDGICLGDWVIILKLHFLLFRRKNGKGLRTNWFCDYKWRRCKSIQKR